MTRMSVGSGPLSDAQRQKRRWLMILSVLVAVGVGLTVVVYALLQPGPPLRILSLAVAPEHPGPGDPITIAATVQGGTFLMPANVIVEFAAFFADAGGGSRSLLSIGDNRYQGQLGPFANGTELWFVVTATTGTEGPTFSGSVTLDIGIVLRDGPSAIAITQVTQTPANPDPLDDVVVMAQVTSKSKQLSVSFSWMSFYRTGGGGGTGSMSQDSSGNWTTVGMIVAGPVPMFSGTVVYYRVAAIDGTQNTALSSVYNYTLR